MSRKGSKEARIDTPGAMNHELPTAADALVEVTLASGERLHVPRQLLSSGPDGSSELKLSSLPTNVNRGREQVVIPIAREEMQVTKSEVVAGRTVVHVTPVTRQEVVEVPLSREEVQIERVPIGRVVEKPGPVREEGEVTIVPIYEEVLVVEKRLMLKEEVRITRRRITVQKQNKVVLRSEEVKIRSTGAHEDRRC